MVSIAAVLAALVVATLLSSIAVIRRLDRSTDRWGDLLRARFVMGVPWGTVVVTLLVLAVYLFVQDGLTNWYEPVTLPYRAWSYLYPLGILTAAFSHANPNHLIGNLVGTVVLAPIAEYAWGHYPTERGSRSFSSWRSNPWVRSLVLFPLAAIGIGLVTSLFALGPVIGFSGVVFAFAGFAIVRYPITTLVAVLGGQGTVLTIYRALQSPVVVATTRASPPSPPWWATIAVQGHALGFFLGFVCSAVILHRRKIRPEPLRLWIAVLFYGFSSSLWAVYWFRGSNTYVLYRGLGVALVTLVALVVTLAITASDRPLLPAALGRVPTAIERRFSGDDGDDGDESVRRILALGLPTDGDDPFAARFATRVRELSAGSRSRTEPTSESLTRRGAAFTVVVVVLALVSGPAVAVNLFAASDDPAASNASVTVEDYTISYAEDVENELVSVFEIEAFGEETTVETSGVIVSSTERRIWTNAISKQHLAFEGNVTTHVGGPGWRHSVTATREGWTPAGNDTVYQVWLRSEGEPPRQAYASEPAQADVRIDGKTITVVPENGTFYVEVSDGEDATAIEIPDEGGSVEVHGLTLSNVDGRIYAATDETRVQVATEERYN